MHDDYSNLVNNPVVSDSDSTTEDSELVNNNNSNLLVIQRKRINKRKNKLDDMGEWITQYDDDVWYLWGLIQDYIKNTNLAILDKMDYSKFAMMCYDNTFFIIT